MLWEAWQAWRIKPRLPFVKPMGYVRESVAMMARKRRCEAQWGKHYQHCREAILETVLQTSQYKKALIFGAGHLVDIPLLELSEKFQKVILVDLLFSPQAISVASHYHNIELIEHDVTESLQALNNALYCSKNILKSPSKWLDDPHVSMVVSLNLVTQLPLIPAKYFYKHNLCSLQEADELAKRMISLHLQYLQQFQVPVCLIADRKVTEFNKQGEVIDSFDPWWEMEHSPVDRSWEWEVAPFGEVNRRSKQVHLVGVSYLNA